MQFLVLLMLSGTGVMAQTEIGIAFGNTLVSAHGQGTDLIYGNSNGWTLNAWAERNFEPISLQAKAYIMGSGSSTFATFHEACREEDCWSTENMQNSSYKPMLGLGISPAIKANLLNNHYFLAIGYSFGAYRCINYAANTRLTTAFDTVSKPGDIMNYSFNSNFAFCYGLYFSNGIKWPMGKHLGGTIEICYQYLISTPTVTYFSTYTDNGRPNVNGVKTANSIGVYSFSFGLYYRLKKAKDK